MAYKVLVVDDEVDLESLVRQRFRQQVRQQVFTFLFATDGLQALDVLAKNPDIDLVLSDINMPRMDGLTLLEHLTSQVPLVKSIIISAYGDMKNIRMAMNRGAFDFVTKPIDFEDLEVTMTRTLKHVEQTKQTIQALRENNILKMYVDESVLRFMSHEEFEKGLTRSELIEATVLFADICSFTSMSENERPDLVVNVLNAVFDTMVQCIVEHNGFIDKFIGDAVMAVFTGPDHALHALHAARSIIAAVKGLETPVSGYHPQIAIGVNTGEMVCGNIGSATLKRLDYTVIGDTVNTAQRLQDVADENEILITEQYYNQVKDQIACELAGTKTLKNKKTPIALFRVL